VVGGEWSVAGGARGAGLGGVGSGLGPGMAGAGNDGSAGNAIDACVAGNAAKPIGMSFDSGPPLRQAQGRALDRERVSSTHDS